MTPDDEGRRDEHIHKSDAVDTDDEKVLGPLV